MTEHKLRQEIPLLRKTRHITLCNHADPYHDEAAFKVALCKRLRNLFSFAMPRKWLSCIPSLRRKKRLSASRTSWSYLPAPAIDKIVSILKKSSRWRRDGPSLRQLNHFWRAQIDEHIHAVFPHSCRQLVWTDVTSLTRFSNLTSLNIERFVPPLESISSVLRSSSTWSRDAQRGQDSFVYHQPSLERMIRTIANLPCLSHLTISADLFYHHRQGRDLWRQLKGITSLEIRREKEVDLDCSSLFYAVFDDFPRVKSIDMTCPPYHPCLMSKLEGMETVKLREAVCPRQLASISGLVSLSVRVLQLEEVDVLEWMPQLTSLAFAVDTRKVLKQLSNAHVLRRLNDLSISSMARLREIKGTFFQECLNLQSLSLEHFRFLGTELSRHLTNLTKLKLQKCTLAGGVSFLAQLTKLEELSFVMGFAQEDGMTGIASAEITLPKLRVLHLKPVANDMTFKAITKFKKLETVHVHCGAVSSQVFKELEYLPELRILSVQFASKALDRSTSLLSLSFLTSLERLSIGSKVATSHIRKHQIENLQRKAPQLTIDLS